MKLAAELIDLKLTSLYALMIAIFSTTNIEFAYKAFAGLILIGYNLHRWYIMYENHKASKKTNSKRLDK